MTEKLLKNNDEPRAAFSSSSYTSLEAFTQTKHFKQNIETERKGEE